MTEKQARDILINYQETEYETGEKYGYIIQEYCGIEGGCHVFRCKIEGVDYNDIHIAGEELPLVGVYPDGSVCILPVQEDIKEFCMINLWKYQDAKKIRIVDIDDDEFIGNVIDVTDAGEYADESITETGITISFDGKHVEFMQSEIKSIEIIEEKTDGT